MPSVYSNKNNDPIKINDFALIKMNYPTNERANFHKVNYGNLGSLGNHYIQIDKLTLNGTTIVSWESRIDNVVWDRGSDTYLHKLNYNYIEGTLYTPDAATIIQDQTFVQIELFIPQLFNWNGVSALLVSIKGTETGDIYVSKTLSINDFDISGSKMQYYGQFWTESNIFNIPLTSEELYIQVQKLSPEDISNLGYIYNYPNEYVPIIYSKPLPDYITTTLTIDNFGFLHIFPKTLENKTLETSLKNYFGYDSDEILNIDISHIIDIEGTNVKTGLPEYKSFRVSNEENNFNEVVIGLDFSDWINPNTTTNTFNIAVRTEYIIDSKVMNRYSYITADFSAEVVNLKNSLINPTSVNFQEVVETTTVQQTIIEKPKEVQIVKVIQPLFVKMIESVIEYQNMNITFDNITEPAYLMVNDETIQTKQTSDEKYYFDLSELTPITEETTYKIINISSEKVIGEGTIR